MKRTSSDGNKIECVKQEFPSGEIIALLTTGDSLYRKAGCVPDLQGVPIFYPAISDKYYISFGICILQQKYTFTSENVEQILHDEVGKGFAEVLEDAGVYKMDDTGREGFLRFLAAV